jgi:two-component system, chemotaxis family, chemotaxis protein CheY
MNTVRVLVVDDSAYARRILRGALEKGGYAVDEAGSGMSAIESYFLERHDIVLLDLTMEDMGGVEVLARLKEIDAGVPVIVISADVQSTTEGVVKAAGASCFLGKPAQGAAVLEAIRSTLGLAE